MSPARSPYSRRLGAYVRGGDREASQQDVIASSGVPVQRSCGLHGTDCLGGGRAEHVWLRWTKLGRRVFGEAPITPHAQITQIEMARRGSAANPRRARGRLFPTARVNKWNLDLCAAPAVSYGCTPESRFGRANSLMPRGPGRARAKAGENTAPSSQIVREKHPSSLHFGGCTHASQPDKHQSCEWPRPSF